ncbi:e9imm peptide [Streptomyces sp. NPDC020472]|uniref:e9imm peptide n=1 Tax=Streptomyces sp. NPDC020472 TaxID=3365075 RepID=UPI0037A37F16
MSTEPARRMTREEAIPLIERLMNPETPEAEFSQLLAILERGLSCPHISDYILWDPDPELTPEKVADRALTYKPIAL